MDELVEVLFRMLKDNGNRFVFRYGQEQDVRQTIRDTLIQENIRLTSARIKELEEEVKQLREALKPFAETVEHDGPGTDLWTRMTNRKPVVWRDDHLVGIDRPGSRIFRLTVGDFRRARRVCDRIYDPERPAAPSSIPHEGW